MSEAGRSIMTAAIRDIGACHRLKSIGWIPQSAPFNPR